VTNSTTRRDLLTAGAGLGIVTASLLGSTRLEAAAQAPKAGNVDFNDPRQRFLAQVKMRGTLAGGPNHTFVRLHIWGYGNEGNLVPFFSMNNYAVNVWRKLDSGNYAVRVFESGVYTVFDSQEVLTEWQNPFTGEKREVHQFRSGPLNVEFGPDGIIAGAETTVKPRPMQVEVIEDTVVAMTQSSFRFPSPFQPEQFPKESPGKIYFWDSHASHSSPLAAVLDPDVPSAPSQVTLTNLVSWAPWMGMAQRPGRTYGRGIGRKISGPGALPPVVVAGLEKYTPQVLDIDNWGPPYDDIADYKAKLEAKRAAEGGDGEGAKPRKPEPL
jgi:hypothetical protein